MISDGVLTDVELCRNGGNALEAGVSGSIPEIGILLVEAGGHDDVECRLEHSAFTEIQQLESVYSSKFNPWIRGN